MQLLPWSPGPVVHKLFGTRDQFHGRQFFHGRGIRGCWFGDDSSALHLLCNFISIIITLASDHQALDPRGWGPPVLDKRRYFFGTLLLEPGHQAQATRRIQG